MRGDRSTDDIDVIDSHRASGIAAHALPDAEVHRDRDIV
jgi:hypothetical protein